MITNLVHSRLILLVLLVFNPLLSQWGLSGSNLIAQDSKDTPLMPVNEPELLIVAGFIIAALLLVSLRLNGINRRLKKSEHMHREVNRRVVTAVNHTDTLIISLNGDGVIRLVNEAAIALFRRWIDREPRAGKNIIAATSGTEAEQVWESWMQKSRNVRSWSEVCQINLNDEKRYFRVSFSSIYRNDGNYTGLVMMGNDVTFEYEYQSELADQHQALEKSNSDKEQMMSILAHDLKDAIYSAHSMSKMVLEDQEDFDRDHLLHLFAMLHDNFDKTQELLESLLAWQKTRNIHLDGRHEEVKLHDLIKNVIDHSSEKISRKKVKVENRVPPDQIIVSDREMLRTVLRNLLSNAIKYTYPEQGSIIFEISGKQPVQLHIRDNGQGMTEEEVARVLEGQNRYSKPGTNDEKGTGVGLYLCQELLRLNDSKLSVKSKPGEGTDFYFTLRAK